MYSPLETVFESTMQREGKTVTTYYSKADFTAFMRRNDDGNNFEDRIYMFYPTNSPVVQGSIIKYGTKLYLLVNRETEENTTYYKSSAIACNGSITLNDGTLSGIPCYAYNMGSALVDNNNVMSVIDGNMEFITEASAKSRQIQIGKTFNEFGRTFKVDNTYFKDGVLHLVCEVYANITPTELNFITITDFSQLTYTVGDTTKIEATMTTNGESVTGTITWTSSNTNVATIDGEGNIEFIGDGSVSFAAYWVEKNITENTDTVSVGSVTPTPSNYTASLEYTGSPKLRIGFEKTLTAHLFDSQNTEIENTTWSFVIDTPYPEEVACTYPTANTIALEIDDEDAMSYGETVTITATENGHGQSASCSLEVVGLF